MTTITATTTRTSTNAPTIRAIMSQEPPGEYRPARPPAGPGVGAAGSDDPVAGDPGGEASAMETKPIGDRLVDNPECDERRGPRGRHRQPPAPSDPDHQQAPASDLRQADDQLWNR